MALYYPRRKEGGKADLEFHAEGNFIVVQPASAPGESSIPAG
jgi:hypothetical protein